MAGPTNPLSTQLDRKGVLVADGGMGTSLFAAGLRPGETPEVWNVENTDAVSDVHRSFIAAGADIVLTNTFGGTSTRLELDGKADRVAELNAAGVEAARAAADGTEVVVAGSVGPTGALFEPLGPMTEDEAVAVFAEQMTALAAAGADALWIETLSSVEELSAAVIAAQAAGLPFVSTMSFDTNGRTMMGVAPASFAGFWDARADSAPIAIGANCGIGPADTVLAVSEISEAGDEVVVISKGNCGIPEVIDGQLWYPASSDDMTAYAELALNAGARIIGACCGSTPEHIAQIRSVVDSYVPDRPFDAAEVEARLGAVARPAERESPPRRRRRSITPTS